MSIVPDAADYVKGYVYELDGQRILSPESVRMMIRDSHVPGRAGARRRDVRSLIQSLIAHRVLQPRATLLDTGEDGQRG